MRRLSIVMIFFTLVSLARGYQPFLSFSSSSSAMNKIYSKYKVLPLSGKHYYFSEGDCSVEGLVDITNQKTEKVQWRHLIPESVIGSGMACMTQRLCQSTLSDKLYSGPGCCRKISLRFKQISSDLFNIIPTVLQEKHKNLIHVKHIFDKGSIARSYLYLIDRYAIKVDESIKKLCLLWHRKYPVSAWEKEKNRKIFKLQGTFNPFIEKL